MKITVFLFVCCLLMFSCANKKNMNESIDSNIEIIDEKNGKNEKQAFLDRKYEYWTLGNRYTTFIFSRRAFDRTYGPNTVMTFVHNLPGFSNVIMLGESKYDNPIATRNYHTINNLMHSRNSALGIGVYPLGNDYAFNITDDGTVILSHTSYDSASDNKLYEIHYKYENNELVLFDYRYGRGRGYQIAEFINMDNKIVLIDNNGDDHILIKEELCELEDLYIKTLRQTFIDILDILPKSNITYGDFGTPDILGIDSLYSLTQKEIMIFEECVYEYFGYSINEDVTGLIDESILVFLEKLKNK